MKTRYVVATSEESAQSLAAEFGWDDLGDALDHLSDLIHPIAGKRNDPTYPAPVPYPEAYCVFEIEVKQCDQDAIADPE